MVRERPYEEPLPVEKGELPAPCPGESRDQWGKKRTALRCPSEKGDKVLQAAWGQSPGPHLGAPGVGYGQTPSIS